MRRLPGERTDESLANRAVDLANAYPALDGRADDVAAALVATVPVSSHDTHRTDAAPERTYAPRVTSAERRLQFGNGSSEVATYPILDGAPVGSVPTLASAQRETRAAMDDAIWARKVAESDARSAKLARDMRRASRGR